MNLFYVIINIGDDMKCNRCGHENRDNALKCSLCGNELVRANNSVNPNTNSYTNNNIYQNNNSYTSDNNSSATQEVIKNNNSFIIRIIVIAIVLFAGYYILAFVVGFNKNKKMFDDATKRTAASSSNSFMDNIKYYVSFSSQGISGYEVSLPITDSNGTVTCKKTSSGWDYNCKEFMEAVEANTKSRAPLSATIILDSSGNVLSGSSFEFRALKNKTITCHYNGNNDITYNDCK